MSNAGLYTREELASWDEQITFPSYKQALMSEIIRGTCATTGQCMTSPDVQSYDLRNLITEQIEGGILSSIKNFIHLNGDYLAAAVLLIVMIRLVTDIILLMFTMLRQGPADCLALLMSLYLSNKLSYQKIKKRNEKMRKKMQKREHKESRKLEIISLNPIPETTEDWDSD